MSFEITATDERTLLVLRAQGQGTAANGQRALNALQAHEAYSQGLPILIDALDVQYAPSDAEARVFAGLFATAFPCSLVAVVASPGAFYEGAMEIAAHAADRGAPVAAFKRTEDALAWIERSSPRAALRQGDASVGAPESRRMADEVVIPYTLRERIETTHVDVDGYYCPLRLDSSSGRPLFEPEIAEVTVSTDYDGAPRQATVDLRISSLDDEDYVVSAVVNAMRSVLAGARTSATATASAARR